MIIPTLKEEKNLIKKGYQVIAGIDEAGRGPIAGPVIAAAITGPAKLKVKSFTCQSFVHPPQVFARQKFGRAGENLDGQGLKVIFGCARDSKLLTPKKREELYKLITHSGFFNWAVGVVSEKVIDKINILEATKLAMIRAVGKLRQKPKFLLIDGKFTLRDFPCNQKAIPGGDKKVFLISCASIIAKVTRDRLMVRYHKKYPQYGFNQHKGYGTKLHFKMLKKYGPCQIHRYSFRPIKS